VRSGERDRRLGGAARTLVVLPFGRAAGLDGAPSGAPSRSSRKSGRSHVTHVADAVEQLELSAPTSEAIRRPFLPRQFGRHGGTCSRASAARSAQARGWSCAARAALRHHHEDRARSLRGDLHECAFGRSGASAGGHVDFPADLQRAVRCRTASLGSALHDLGAARVPAPAAVGARRASRRANAMRVASARSWATMRIATPRRGGLDAQLRNISTAASSAISAIVIRSPPAVLATTPRGRKRSPRSRAAARRGKRLHPSGGGAATCHDQRPATAGATRVVAEIGVPNLGDGSANLPTASGVRTNAKGGQTGSASCGLPGSSRRGRGRSASAVRRGPPPPPPASGPRRGRERAPAAAAHDS